MTIINKAIYVGPVKSLDTPTNLSFFITSCIVEQYWGHNNLNMVKLCGKQKVFSGGQKIIGSIPCLGSIHALNCFGMPVRSTSCNQCSDYSQVFLIAALSLSVASNICDVFVMIEMEISSTDNFKFSRNLPCLQYYRSWFCRLEGHPWPAYHPFFSPLGIHPALGTDSRYWFCSDSVYRLPVKACIGAWQIPDLDLYLCIIVFIARTKLMTEIV